jgi:thioredoxin reductase (NADPH)
VGNSSGKKEMAEAHDSRVDRLVNAEAKGDVHVMKKTESWQNQPLSDEYDYHVVVIGGGSGGLACAKEAADLGARVAVFDYVKPSPHGTAWGLGGTCVNVGCIPKKLMHQAAIHGANHYDSAYFGWEYSEKPKHNWSTMVTNINNYIQNLNGAYEDQLMSKKVTYINALGTFDGPHTIKYEEGKATKKITAQYIVIAVGGRPRSLNIPGAELAISSDDIFWKKESPGKTLCVGASYISLETAGFLNKMNLDVHIMVRSILLRGFDRECADSIGKYMADQGCTFHMKCSPTKMERTEDGRIKVTWMNSESESGVECSDVFDTVMLAVGRNADTGKLGLETAGVKTAKNGKFDVVQERTNVPHIFAIGDVVNGGQELTPVAIQVGKLLSRRLVKGSNRQMDYDKVATTVFTPLEYGCIGYSEEDAIKKFGDDNVDVYMKQYTALEQSMIEKYKNSHVSKLIVLRNENERVIGFHYLGPNAGEVTQGFALAMKLGATKDDFDDVVGIHPTVAENFTILDVTKRSGKAISSAACAT